MATRIEYILELIDQASDELRHVESAAAGAEKGLDNVGSSAQNTESRLGKIAKAAAAAAAVLGTVAAAAAGKFAKSTLGLASDLELAESQLAILTGSSEVAARRMDELFRLTTETPFLFPELVEAEVALTSFGANAEEMLPAVIDVAAALGKTLPEAAHSIGKAFGSGAAGVDSLRESMPKVFALLQENLGGSTGDLEKFREALEAAVSDETFAGGAAALSETYAGAISNLQGQFTEFQKSVAESGLFESVKQTVIVINETIDAAQGKVDDLGVEVGRSLTRKFFESLQVIGHIVDAVELLAALIKAAIGGALNAVGLAVSGLLGAFLELGGLLTRIIPGESEYGKRLNALKNQNRAFFKDQASATIDAFVDPVASAMGRDFSETIGDIVDRARARSLEAAAEDETATAIISQSKAPNQKAPSITAAINQSEAAVKAFTEQLSALSDLPIEERAEKMRALVKAAEVLPDLIPMEDYLAALENLQTLEQEIADKRVEALEVEKQAIEEMRQAQLESFGQVGDLLGSVVAGGVGAITGVLQALGPQGAVVSSFVSAFHALGEQGAQDVAANIEAAFDTVVSGILELPELLTEALPDVMSRLIEGLIENAPEIAAALGHALLLAMPSMVAGMIEGLYNGIIGIADRILSAIGLGGETRESLSAVSRVAFGVGTGGRSELLRLLFGADQYQTGGYVDRTGMALVHQGEYVVPAGGGGSQAARQFGSTAAAGVNVTINTSVVDPNAIPSLVKQIERVFGTNGRASSPLFAI